MNKGFVCERCHRENIWVSWRCESCHRAVCKNCITISLRVGKQVCLDCYNKWREKVGKILEEITLEDYGHSRHFKKRVSDRHKLLWQVCRDKPSYEDGTDTEQHNKPDCSCGCVFHHALDGITGMDWGVCCCPQSPRAGLLTFEHMGCQFWTKDNNL